MSNSHYGKPRKPVHLGYVHCSGSEEQILSCMHFELPSLDEKKRALNKSDVAGVICQSSSTSSSRNLASSSTSRGPIPTSAPNNAPGDPTFNSTSSDQNTDEHFDELTSLVITNYLIAFALIVGLLIAIV